MSKSIARQTLSQASGSTAGVEYVYSAFSPNKGVSQGLLKILKLGNQQLNSSALLRLYDRNGMLKWQAPASLPASGPTYGVPTYPNNPMGIPLEYGEYWTVVFGTACTGSGYYITVDAEFDPDARMM
jgi:hypothetical protein